MLALGFLIMIGMALVADSFGANVPKGYIYSAMAFSVLVELLNLFARRRKAHAEPPVHLRPAYVKEYLEPGAGTVPTPGPDGTQRAAPTEPAGGRRG